MKTAIASNDNTENARVDAHFGRCNYFFILDTESGTSEVTENPAGRDPGCRGEKIVEFLLLQGVQRVIAGDFGPHAQQLMARYGIQMVIQPDPTRSVRETTRQLIEVKKLTRQ